VLQSWNESSGSAVAAGWGYGEEIRDREPLNRSDDEFDLRVATDSDDEKAAILRSEIEGAMEEQADAGLTAVSIPVKRSW
jgi:hypothetical protein